jgi:periplasmic copper chaperone A
MTRSRARKGGVALAVSTVAALVLSAGAWAHAELSPPVAKAKAGQVFTLAVPTEEEGATTTTIELTPPAGFAIDSFAPAPGWKRSVQQTGSGEDAVIQKVTWTGGSVPTGEDSVFQFLADPTESKTYSFNVRQTYSNGKVVDWAGEESSDTPAPTIEAKSSLGGGGSSTLSIVALVVGGLGLLVAVFALVGGKRQLA